MITFRQHIPSFVDRRSPIPTYEVETTEELLALEVVDGYRTHGDKVFSHFCLSDNALMIVMDEGYWFWVVGFVTGDVSLPEWDGGKTRARLKSGEGVCLTRKEILSSGGGILNLRDGTTATELDYEPYLERKRRYAKEPSNE